MKLEKDRLIAKVDSLELSLKQLRDEENDPDNQFGATQTSKRQTKPDGDLSRVEKTSQSVAGAKANI